MIADPVTSSERPIIFFDGVCGLCNRFVDFVIRRDNKQIFKFAPLQGETARQLPPVSVKPDEWSMILLDEHGTHLGAEAAIEILRRLGGVWKAATIARFMPFSVRNWGYRLIARNRYRWFGRREVCRIPSPPETERFLP
ncbi:DUF393 domain-containing protein [Candidatus Sumerlaeota bacterium]|nr:DUF393 domain-containing protein [Candidatus Sumerlaeota bacterium]